MDGMVWYEMIWDRMGWDEIGWDGMGWDGMGWDGMGWDGMDGWMDGWNGMVTEDGDRLTDSVYSYLPGSMHTRKIN